MVHIFVEGCMEAPVGAVELDGEGRDGATLAHIRQICHHLDDIPSDFVFLKKGRTVERIYEDTTKAYTLFPEIILRAHRTQKREPKLSKASLTPYPSSVLCRENDAQIFPPSDTSNSSSSQSTATTTTTTHTNGSSSTHPHLTNGFTSSGSGVDYKISFSEGQGDNSSSKSEQQSPLEVRLHIFVENLKTEVGSIGIEGDGATLADIRQVCLLLRGVPSNFAFVTKGQQVSIHSESQTDALDCIPQIFLREIPPLPNYFPISKSSHYEDPVIGDEYCQQNRIHLLLDKR
eukprot:TRINITY_DN2442_c0_g1_i1.p1 TRINITY_DN2442_c0_g1~~TRINITY_DN2442_c0_g1_i1.p1  ORF type:complete len:289 (-),score=57.91 TRINITY_DN2442_c0_g1_i1:46-912(-)